MKRKRFEIITTVLFIAVLLFAGLNAVRFFTRFDITENKIYTISEVSKNLFEDIEEQVTITYYRSNRLKNLSQIPEQVEDMLNEYAAFSRGKIVVHSVDPAEAGEEQLAESFGIVPQQVEVLEKNERSFALIYSGIVIEYLTEYTAIPVVVRTETLEYDLTTKIRSLIYDRERTVGIIVGDVNKNLEQDYTMFLQSLQGTFIYREIPMGEPIPPDITVLLVLGNKDIMEEHIAVIDGFISAGGNALFLAESVYIDLAANLQAGKIENSALTDYLRSYGIELEPYFVCDEYNRDFRIPAQMFGNVAWQIIGPYPLWISILQNNVSGSNPVTARFSGLDLLWPNPLTIAERKEGHEYEILMESSEESWLLKDNFNTNPYQAQMLRMYKKESRGQYPLGISVTGASRIAVIGDADFASNLMQYSNSTYNIGFLQNMLEWLSNDDELLEIKTRGQRDMRLNKIQDPEGKKRVYIVSAVFNIVIIPIFFIAFGVRRFIRRKKLMTIQED